MKSPGLEDEFDDGVERDSLVKPENSGFAKRLTLAADRCESVPGRNNGRYTWIQRALERHGERVSRETIRKWFSGIARPRPSKLSILAEILGADEGWLAVGASLGDLPHSAKTIKIHNQGAVNAVLGMFGLAGVTCAFADEGSTPDEMHFNAILGGRVRKVYVTLAQVKGNEVRFFGPGVYTNILTIGVVQTGPSSLRCFEITPKTLATVGKYRAGFVELRGTLTDKGVDLGQNTLPDITDFSEIGRDLSACPPENRA